MYMYILYAIIIIVVCLFIYSMWTRRKIYKEVDRLDEWKMEISNKPITDEIAKIKGLKMSGETEEKFETWRKSWDEIIAVRLPNLEEDLFDVEEYVNKYRFNKAKKLSEEIATKLQQIEDELRILLDDVNGLVKSEEKNREEISDIRKQYYEVRKNFSVHRGSFGKTATLIEERLENLYKEFPKFDEAQEAGNYLEARDLLENIKEELAKLEEIMKVVPNLLVQLESHIPSDLKNLLDGLKEMEEDGYAIEHFSIEDNIKQMEKECSEALEKLNVLEIEFVEGRLKEINESIDSMYEALETEVKSRAYVLQAIHDIQDRLEATNEQLEHLFSETEFVQHSYHITEEELRHQQQLSKNLKELIQRLMTIDTIVEEKKQSYTSIHKMLDDFNKEYDELDQQIEEATNKLSALRHDELKARDTLKQLKGKLLEAKRDVQKSNIPGLPEAIIEQINYSERALNVASESLTEVPLNMNAVISKTEEAVAHVETAVDKIKETIELAKLAELIIQYGNRYRSYSIDVNEQLNEAELAFRQFYYEDAIELAKVAIERYEPNVMEKIKQFVPS